MTAEAEVILDEIKTSLHRLQSPWVNRREAAAYTGRGMRSIDRAADQGIINRYDRSGIPVFKKTELDNWLENGPKIKPE